MAFDSKPTGQPPRSLSRADLPEATRPRAETWNALREDGIQWEGQVLIVGAGMDIPALLVLTLSRLVLISAGDLVLDIPRAWLRPEPKLLAENGVRLSMTPLEGGGRAQTDRLTVRVRAGRGSAAKLVSTISGRIVSPRESHSIRTSDAPDGWRSDVGASAPMALPPLPELDDARPAPTRSTWPPVETHGVAEPPRRPVRHPRAATARPVAAPPARGTVTEPAAASPAPSWSTATHTRSQVFAAPVDPVHEAMADDERRSNRGLIWGLRTLILAILVGTAAYFGRDTLAERFDLQLPASIEQRFGLDDETPPADLSMVPGDTQQGSDTGTTEPVATQSDSDGTNGPRNRDTIVTGNEETPAVGGDNGEPITPVDPGIGTYADDAEPPATDEPVEPTTAPAEPTSEPVAPTEAPAEPTTQPVEPTAIPAEPTSEPTAAPVTEAPPTEAPTNVPPTEAPPTAEPATEAPPTEAPVETTEPIATEVPGRQDSTPTVEATEAPTEAATQAPTEAPATATSEPTLESQPPSVEEGATPEQVISSNGFRYTVTGVAQGATIPDVPQLADPGTGEWVVVTLQGQNWNGSEQVFDMSQFRLLADGQDVLLDVGTQWVGGQLGLTPAYGNTDAILWAADEAHPLALTFLVPNGTQELTLVAGDQSMDLTSALAEPQPLAQDAEVAAPEYIEATVAEVVDAETIVIEKDGLTQTVRYLGVDVPTRDDCFADEATAANKELVEGKTVRIERQATDVDARGNWVRDVWAPDEEGRYFLVAESMVSQGAATVAISEPNTRFESWLMGAQSMAKSDQRGLWGACEQEATGLPDHQQAIVTTPQQVTNRRQRG